MTITRIDPSTRWSNAVIHNKTVYCVEVATTPYADITQQTHEVLANIEAILVRAGSSKAQLLSVTIYLDDIREIDAFNTVWDQWLPMGCAPSRACVQARLAHPGYRVELQVVAALAEAA